MANTTYAFDNCRFFAPRSVGGVESGGRGWVRITTKGRRETLGGIDPQRSALVVVDMQHGCVHGWDVDYARLADDPTEPADLRQAARRLGTEFGRRMAGVTIPGIQALLELFRRHGLLVVFLVLGEDEVIPELQPLAGEPVLRKYSSGAFATSALDNALREHGIGTVFFTGTDTAGCVDGTMSEAYDRGYQTVLVEDACCSSRQDMHDAVVHIWACKGFVRNSEQVVRDYPWQAWVDGAASG